MLSLKPKVDRKRISFNGVITKLHDHLRCWKCMEFCAVCGTCYCDGGRP